MTTKKIITIGSYMKLFIKIADSPDKSLNRMCKEAGVWYPHSHGIVTWGETGGLLTRQRIGREVRITLTERGLKMAEACRAISEIVNGVEVQNEKRNRIPDIR